jgi:hypothetical protein
VMPPAPVRGVTVLLVMVLLVMVLLVMVLP